jgi:prepilin-type N-terminal cleavage/methylation domain-containing protein
LKLNHFKSTRGFSLVELLLTLVLLLCLAAASVFSYTALHRSANLDEGANRLQSLIRFAQAEAATSGRKVRLEFETGANPVRTEGSENLELRQIKVTWEADFLHEPGVFQEYTNKAWSENIVNELVGVTKVQPIQSPNAPAKSSDVGAAATSDSSKEMSDDELFADELPAEEFPSITFYPDGSCDSAEIVLASRNSDDERLMAVRLSGILGSVSSHAVSKDGESSFEEVESSDSQSSDSSTESEAPEQNFSELEGE